jgi:hypothetical protein
MEDGSYMGFALLGWGLLCAASGLLHEKYKNRARMHHALGEADGTMTTGIERKADQKGND